MCMLGRRTQILLDEERYEKVTRMARERGISVAAVIREAIDALPSPANRRQAAITAILAAEPMDLPANADDLRAELDAAHSFR